MMLVWPKAAFPGEAFPAGHGVMCFGNGSSSPNTTARRGQECCGHPCVASPSQEGGTGSACTHSKARGDYPTLDRPWEIHAPQKGGMCLGWGWGTWWVQQGKGSITIIAHHILMHPGAIPECRLLPAPRHAQPAQDRNIPHQK